MIHILVVDDDKNLNQTVCTYLNDCGFEAKGVLSANEAYDEMYNNLYELIISDIMMPTDLNLQRQCGRSINRSRSFSCRLRMIFLPNGKDF